MRILELLRNMGILAIGGICTKAINFMLLPLYTSLISAEEYGTIDLLTTIVTLLVSVVGFQVYDAIFKYATIKRDNLQEIKIIFTNNWIFCMCSTIVFSGVCLILFYFFDFTGKWYVMSAVMSTIFLYISTNSSRSLGHNKLYSFANFVSALITVVLNLFFLIVLKWPALTILYAYVVGPLVGGLVCVVKDKLWRYFSLNLVNVAKIKEYLSYSLPLIPNEIAWWVIHASDRLVVTAFLGIYHTGMLAVATKFSLVYSTIFGFFYAAWSEQCFLHYNTTSGRKYIQELIPKVFVSFYYFTLILMIVCMYIYPVVINQEYREAMILIPWYLIAVLLNVIIGLITPIYLVSNETKFVMHSTIVAGLINLVVNILLVSNIGILSAPIAAIVGYGCVVIWRLRDINKRYMHISWSIKKNLVMLCLLALVIWVYYFHNEGYIGVCVFTMVFFSMIFEFSKYRKQN